jgi:hypothetical protein
MDYGVTTVSRLRKDAALFKPNLFRRKMDSVLCLICLTAEIDI